MPITFNRGQKFGIGALALAGALAAGYALGRVGASSDQVETIEIPPYSIRSTGSGERFCTQNEALARFQAGSDPQVSSQIRSLGARVTVAFDRGVVCNLTGLLVRQHRQRLVETREPFNIFMLVALNGKAEIISQDFANALASSQAISALASNFGVKADIVPVPDIRILKGDKL
ncbi:hypothetical protein NPS53_09030 [Pseudomonas putida]|uniref:hypothetical protein n=1 Tax=Pseudomonas putida TaxID=303 RepID=UPI0023634A1D|nr:hypothetical protein [Pseudomonas putida]MDD2139718.1 hypothetical protein [Pseudomonas putida]HDS1721642.1 hypothetical protein [Pseudomonas putida]